MLAKPINLRSLDSVFTSRVGYELNSELFKAVVIRNTKKQN
jgi:hypothetical protein